jgi:predicted membrane channel-forming protein YqfA (hemolysin III family)
MENWIVAITLLPGIGLFILSTSNLAGLLGSEVNLLLEKENTPAKMIRRKIDQLKRLHIALTTLYISAICFIVAAFIGSLKNAEIETSDKIFGILIITGIGLLMIAIIHMIIFAYKSIYNREQQFKNRLENLKKSQEKDNK